MKTGIRQQATGNSKKPKVIGFALCAMLLALGHTASAQPPGKVYRIGYLNQTVFSEDLVRRETFRRALHELGYIEGKNIVIEWRSGEGRPERTTELAFELVRLKVEVIVTAGGSSTRAAKKATVAIPIVMTQDTDPVRNGFVASLARPGGNITGSSRLAPELSGKQMELLKEIIPRLSRLTVIGRPSNEQMFKEIDLAAEALGLKLQYLEVPGPADFETAFRGAVKGHADAGLMLASGPILNPNRKRVAELAVKSRIPVIYRNREDVEAGGLMAYGASLTDLDRRAAVYADKILKGAKPADLPVEQPTKFELVINLKTAKQIGLTIPQSVLFRADRVIK